MLTTTLALLPKDWFADAPQLALLAIVVVTMVMVIKGADWLVEGAAGIASRLGMPKVVIGATIVSLGTTSPEAAVSVLAAWQGNAGLALGNGVGSIIADTGLIFGLGCIMASRLPADRFVLSRQGWVQFGSGVLLAALCYGKYAAQGDAAVLTRPTGALLLVLLVVYMAVSVRWARQHGRVAPVAEAEMELETDQVLHHAAEKSLAALLGIGAIGLALVVLGGDALVGSVGELALRWGVPDVVIAGTLVAFGTSLPELVVGLTAVRKGHPELLVGNVIGADILNVLFVIGAAALAAPLPIIDTNPDAVMPRVFLQLHLPTMLAMLVLFRIYIAMATRRGEFSRWMGWPLVVMYVAYVALQFILTAGPAAH